MQASWRPPNNPQVLQLGGRQSVSEGWRTLAPLLHLMAEPKLNCMQRTTSVVGSACGASTTPSRLRGALNVLDFSEVVRELLLQISIHVMVLSSRHRNILSCSTSCMVGCSSCAVMGHAILAALKARTTL